MLFYSDDKSWLQRLDHFCKDLNETFLMDVRFAPFFPSFYFSF